MEETKEQFCYSGQYRSMYILISILLMFLCVCILMYTALALVKLSKLKTKKISNNDNQYGLRYPNDDCKLVASEE